MRNYLNIIVAYSIMMFLIILVGIFQSWSIALTIFNYCMISAVMTLGANIQWGYAGLINFGIMGYTALGGLAVVLVSVAPVAFSTVGLKSKQSVKLNSPVGSGSSGSTLVAEYVGILSYCI